MILVVGARGNMGKRYSKILDYLNVSWLGVDREHSIDEIQFLAESSRGVIIASPTDMHFDHLMTLSKSRTPVLCEKPFTKDQNELREIVNAYNTSKTPISMVCQYQYLVSPGSVGPTSYNYFKHGGDGIYWDCIQIIGLAKGEVKIQETSPIWRCTINGQIMNISDMDMAYVKMIETWLAGQNMPLERIYEFHQKTREFEKLHNH